MLANAIDEPSVLSKSVEACGSFLRLNRGRGERGREREGGREKEGKRGKNINGQ